MKKSLLLAAFVAAALLSILGPDRVPLPRSEVPASLAASDEALARAFEHRLSDIRVEGRGVVAGILPDDDDGSRHQRFILRLASGQTVLVAHNIDLAPRIGSLRVGDPVAFSGVYEWNSRGGVIHWTHDDPGGFHPAGWLRHGERTYR